MDGLWTSELSIADLATSDAFHRRQVLLQSASTSQGSDQGDPVEYRARALRVLIVDGNRNSADTMANLVKRGGHTARTACDGFAALRMAADRHPDVVLLDLEIPLMDACRIAQHLRLDDPGRDSLIIAVSERADEASRRQCVEAGIDLLLLKPLDPEVIDILLVLECARINSRRRSRSGSTSQASANRTAQFIGSKEFTWE